MMQSATFEFVKDDVHYTVIFVVKDDKTIIKVADRTPYQYRRWESFEYPHRLTGYTKKGSEKIVHGRANPNQTNAKYWISEYRKKVSNGNA